MNNIFIKDLREAIKIAPVWLFMAHQDIIARYRRTTLGPWWITIGTGIGLIGMGTIWATLFQMELKDFFPYFTTGFVCWMFLATSVTESPNIFLGAAGTLKTIPLPYFTFIFLSILRNLYTLAHTFVLILIVLFTFPIKITWITLLFIPGLALVLIGSFLLSVILGILGGRFRDLSHLIAAIMTFAMLLTPIMWNPDMLTGGKRCVLYLNPLNYFLSVFRQPLLNKIPPMESYIGVVVIIGLLGVLANYLYKRFSKRLIFWI